MFEDEERKEKLSNLGNSLEALEELIDFEMFRPVLEESLSNKERKSNAGRTPASGSSWRCRTITRSDSWTAPSTMPHAPS